MRNLSPDVLISKFKQLENDLDRLRARLKTKMENYCGALDVLYGTLLDEADTALRSNPTASSSFIRA
jgi:hypothetical protein